MKRCHAIGIALVLCCTASGHAATMREDPAADLAIVRGLKTLSGVQLSIAYTINQSLAYDFFVPCLDYADSQTAVAAQGLVLRDVEADTRNAVIDIYGKLDRHAAYKGRDNLRARALDATLALLTDRIKPSEGRNLGFLCAAATRFERVEVDFDAAAERFKGEFAELAGGSAVFDLPLMRALASAQFWPSAEGRRRVADLGAGRAASVARGDSLRGAYLYAYAALAHPDPREFIRLGDLALRAAAADRMVIEIMLFSRMSQMIEPAAAAQLELLRQIFSRAMPTRRAAEMLPVDHLDRVTWSAIENFINLPSEHYTVQEYDAALRIMEHASLIHREVRDPEEQLAFDPNANAWSKRFLFLNYQTQDYRRMVGRARVDILRQMQVAATAPEDIRRLIEDTILSASGPVSNMQLQAYNPGYRDILKYAKTEDLTRALALYLRTGDEGYFDLALFAVQATFLNLTDLSLRWQKLRGLAGSAQNKQLVAESQRLLFGFEPEMMQLLQYIDSVQVGDRPLTRPQIEDIHQRYRQAAQPFNNRHAVLQDMFRRIPQAQQTLAADPPRLADIRAVLRPREAAIYIARVDDDYLRFLVTRDVTRFSHNRDSEERVRGLVNRMVENLTPGASGGYAAFDRQASRELYDLTIAPLEAHLGGIDRLVWIGPDALAGLSPEVFTGADGRLLFERFTVTLNSSPGDLVESRRGAARPRDDVIAVLAVGAPQSSAAEIACLTAGDCPVQSAAGRFRNLADAPDGSIVLAPLPETAAEMVALRDALDPVDARLLLGPDARVATVREEAGRRRWDLLAFATHGVPGDRLESVGLTEPALLLGRPEDGRPAFLSTSEIAGLGLEGDPIVVLSACDTARASNGSIYFDSLSGFYQAFRLAGAKGVVATQWEVSSDAAERLIPDFIRRARQGESFSEALRNAKIRLRDDAPEALRHPGYWMPFAFLGDGGATF